MELFSATDIIELLNAESDISIVQIASNKIHLSHAPIDVESASIKLHKGAIYLELSTLIKFLSREVFGTPVLPLFNSNGVWTHITTKQ